MKFWRSARDRELAKEMAAHKAERVDDLIERGLSETEARKQAAREFGNLTVHAEQSREVWIAPWLSSVGQDIRYAIRSTVRQPGFTLTTVLVLALGIGLVSTFFVVFNAGVLKPWPVHDPSSIAIIRANPRRPGEFPTISWAEQRYLRARATSFSQLASAMRGGGPVRGLALDSTAQPASVRNVQTSFVTANYLDALGVRMELGRSFTAADEDYGAPKAVAIVSERVWRRESGSSPALIGRAITLYNQPFTVIGVAEQGFQDVDGPGVDLWLPLPSIALVFPDTGYARMFDDPKGSGGSVFFGRRRSGISQQQAAAELDVLSRQFRAAVPMDAPGVLLHGTRPLSGNDPGLQKQLPIMGMLFGALMLVMLVACANAGNLMLARALARQREIAIRLSLGAARGRIIRQLLTESMLVAGLAGGIGLAIAAAVPQIILLGLLKAGAGNARAGLYAPDAVVLTFVFGMSALACLLSGLAPALRLTRPSIAVIAGDRHGATIGGTKLRQLLLGAQVALTAVLLIGAGLLTRAIGHALTTDPGFAIDDVEVVTVQLPGGAGGGRLRALNDIALSPDFPPVALAEFAPFDGAWRELGYTMNVEGQELTRSALTRDVSERYFEVLGLRLIAGRPFDNDSARHEVVVSASIANLFPEGRALGRTVATRQRAATPRSSSASVMAVPGSSPEIVDVSYEIVGVVPDVPVRSMGEIGPTVYRALQGPAGKLLVRGGTPGTRDRIAAVVEGVAPGAVVTSVPLRARIADTLAGLVMGSRVAWAIGLLALALATIGAFGVFAYMVEERRREIGVRMALGARGAAVTRLVLVGASRPVIGGLLAGLVLALGASPLLRSVLYGLSPFDPIAYLQIVAILSAAAVLATWIPARRAARIDPAVTLRAD